MSLSLGLGFTHTSAIPEVLGWYVAVYVFHGRLRVGDGVWAGTGM